MCNFKNGGLQAAADPAPTESSTLAGSAVMQGQVSAFFMMDPLASAVSTRIMLTVAREIYLKS